MGLGVKALIICLGIGSLCTCLWLWLYRNKLKIPTRSIPFFAVLNTMLGVCCTRVFAGIESFGSPFFSGQSLFGSIFLLPAFYIIGAKFFHRRLCDVFDTFAMCTITTLIFARAACLFGGCCYGIFLPGSTVLRWPTREMEIAFYIILLVILYRRIKKEICPGEIWPLYMMAYGAFRFLVEWLREGDAVLGPLHRGHVWAVISMIIGYSIFSVLHEYEKREKRRERKQ